MCTLHNPADREAYLLACLEQHIVAAEGRITRVTRVRDWLDTAGHDKRHAELLLHQFDEILSLWISWREKLLRNENPADEAIGRAPATTDKTKITGRVPDRIRSAANWR